MNTQNYSTHTIQEKFGSILVKIKTKNMTIETTTVEQTANAVLKTEAKTLYYLIIKNKKGEQMVINVGKKTHEEVTKLNKNDK